MAVIRKTDKGINYDEVMREMQQKPNGEYRVIFDKIRPKKTSPQNRYLWGTVYPTILTPLINLGYELTTDEEVHEFCKENFSGKTVNKHTAEIIDIPDSTKEMDTVTFNTYIQVISEWAAEFLQIEIPQPVHEQN